MQNPNASSEKDEAPDEKGEAPRSYYYDDAHGYQEYEPDCDDDETKKIDESE